MSRLDRDSLNMNLAKVVSLRGTCLRAKVGAVVVKDRRVVSTGYNGAPTGGPHCNDETCTPNEPCKNSIHAEANAIAYAAKHGVALRGAVIYVTHSPCQKCSELIIQSGITEVIYAKKYRATPFKMLKDGGVRVAEIEDFVNVVNEDKL
jgi:dCMP deaminase